VAFKSPLIPLFQRGNVRDPLFKGEIKGFSLFQKGKIPLIPLFGKEGLGEIL
jgi:hypothetical protein